MIASVTRSRLLLALGMAAANISWPRLARAQAVTTIRVGAPNPDDGTAAMLYAIHSGLFARAGIAVEIVAASSGAAVAAAVAGGAVDIGFSSLVPLVSAHARGVPFQLVAPGAVYTTDAPYSGMLVRKDSPLRTARDLDGKTVSASALRDLGAVSTLAWIDQNGGDSTTVKTVELPQSAVLAAIDEGRIDAGSLLEPRLSAALAGGTVRLFAKTYDAFGKQFPITAWFATTDYIAQNGDLVVRFARAMREANVYSNAHPAETAPLVAASSRVDLNTIEHSARVKFADVLAVGEIQSIVDLSLKYGVIDKRFAARELVSPVVNFLVR